MPFRLGLQNKSDSCSSDPKIYGRGKCAYHNNNIRPTKYQIPMLCGPGSVVGAHLLFYKRAQKTQESAV